MNKKQTVDSSAQNSSKPLVGSSVCLPEREQKLVNGWIKELSEAGFTPDDMIAVFREARRKYEDFKKRKQNKNGKVVSR
jgi:chorismate mutase